jgi:hypothetical protein
MNRRKTDKLLKTADIAEIALLSVIIAEIALSSNNIAEIAP